MSALTHLDDTGAAHMVDVGGKPHSERLAVAEGHITMRAATLRLIIDGGHRKGDVLAVARVAGIMAAKKTAELIPLCHQVPISQASIEFEADPATGRLRCQATVRTLGQTGVEMEALTGVQIALLTVYDMCKAVDKSMVIDTVRLLQKSGGRGGDWRAAP